MPAQAALFALTESFSIAGNGVGGNTHTRSFTGLPAPALGHTDIVDGTTDAFDRLVGAGDLGSTEYFDVDVDGSFATRLGGGAANPDFDALVFASSKLADGAITLTFREGPDSASLTATSYIRFDYAFDARNNSIATSTGTVFTGPVFDTGLLVPLVAGTLDVGDSVTLAFTAANVTADPGSLTPLGSGTRTISDFTAQELGLSLTGVGLTGAHAAHFSLASFAPSVIGAGGSGGGTVTLTYLGGLADGTLFDLALALDTDEGAPFGGAGARHLYAIAGQTAAPVSAPGLAALLLAAMLRLRRYQATSSPE